jgi:non-specific serine/threonine protein kinase
MEYSVPPLAQPEAVDLFCARAQLDPSEEIAELCARLDSLPLAVELAAARTKALSPAQILERLSQRLDLLQGGRDADPRQQTLRATIEWSYDLLFPEEKRLFARLSVFAGGCTLEAAEEVADADLDILQSLVEKSLLRFTASDAGARYWMLETIREYAQERLAERDDTVATLTRCTQYFVNLAEHAYPHATGPDPAASFDRLEREHDNFRATLARVRGTREYEVELGLAVALQPFRLARGYLTEGRVSLMEALALAGDSPLRARALHHAGLIALTQGRHDEAEALLEEAWTLARQTDDISLTARLLLTLAGAVSVRDETKAEALYEELLVFMQEHGEEHFPKAFVNLGDFALRQGDYARARQYSQRSLQLLGEQGDVSARALALGNLGLALLGLGREAEAWEQLAGSLRLHASIGDKHGIATDLSALASVIAGRGELERAARLLAHADLLLGEIEADISGLGLEGALYERTLARARADVEDFETVWSQGQEMTLPEAIAEALGEPATAT